MLVQIDQRGSLNLPIKVRQSLGLGKGSNFELEIAEGGDIILHPVEINRTVRLSTQGLDKLDEARKSGKSKLPNWLTDEMN
ncbi:AbrB/MazE/SpoVT family DNA-binding domain-containing protein [Candidatus Woesearchaeota archaeon]|jgi:bifunctional DNA-binding transcriptional regulator/antitoxin component of YhaV-PrlF toxin-antitoxin module|nr:AbrB/MazE/SpoVT family DNA-binding domain-containing protein [Candidatus Woesearchaeota archaeon]